MAEEVTVTPRADYELFISGASSPRLNWIKGPLNEFVVVCLQFRRNLMDLDHNCTNAAHLMT